MKIPADGDSLGAAFDITAAYVNQALSAAKERHQKDRESRYPGSIVWAGQEYAGGGVFLGPLEQVPKADGSGYVSMQRFSIIIRKTVLPTPPGKRKTFESCGHTWCVDQIEGQSPTAIAWIIKALRFPDPP